MNRLHILIIVAVMLIFAATAVTADQEGHQQSPGSSGGAGPDEGHYYAIGVALGTVNAVLCAALIIFYAHIWRKTRSEFSLGLIVLSMALLLNTLVSNPWFHDVCGYRGQGLGPFSVLPQVFTAVALCILVYLASR